MRERRHEMHQAVGYSPRQLLPRCSPSVSRDPALAQKKTVIRSVPIGNLRTLDPIWTTAYITRNHAYMIWDTLFALDADNKPQPQMVDTWSVSDDKLTYTLHAARRPQMARRSAGDGCGLRRLDAPLGRQGRHGPGAPRAIRPRSRRWTPRPSRLVLKQPIGFVIDALAKIDSNVPFMMPERIARTDPNTAITEMIGSGPFRFIASEWVPGSKVVYEKFTDYVPRKEPASQAAGGKVVYVDRVESIYMPDTGSPWRRSRAASSICTNRRRPISWRWSRSHPDVVTVPNDKLGWQLFMSLNHLHPPFDNKAVRQAVLWGIKQEEFLVAMAGDAKRYQVCAAIFACGLPNESKVGTEPLLSAQSRQGQEHAAGGGRAGRARRPDGPDRQHGASCRAHRRAGAAPDGLHGGRRGDGLVDADPAPRLQGAARAGRMERVPHQRDRDRRRKSAGQQLRQELRRSLVSLGVRSAHRRSQLGQWALETDPAKRKQITDELQRVHLENVTLVPLGSIGPRSSIARSSPGSFRGRRFSTGTSRRRERTA